MTAAPVATCRHHWILEPLPRRGRISGECRKCGESRDWPAAPDVDHNRVIFGESADGGGLAETLGALD